MSLSKEARLALVSVLQEKAGYSAAQAIAAVDIEGMSVDVFRAEMLYAAVIAESASPRHTECGNKIAAAIRASADVQPKAEGVQA